MRMRVIIWFAVAVWLGLWLYFTRYAMLDDALIHLRYAVNLHKLNYFTFNGGIPSYGASSVFYVWLLSLMTSVPGVVFLPKILSSICYVGVILVLGHLALRPKLGRAQFVLWMLLLLCNLSPMAIRWMPNGMETSMVSLATAAFAVITDRFSVRPSSSPLTFATLAAFGFLLTMLRVELASLSVIVGIVLLLGRTRTDQNRYFVLIDGFAPGLGAIAALGVIYHIFGSLLPDTAIAKSASPSIDPLFASAQVIVSSFVFGIGLLGIAAISAILLMRELLVQGRINLNILLQYAAANSLFPMLVFLACLRGQSIQGIRYLVWPLLFSSIWNLLQLDSLRAKTEIYSPKSDSLIPRYIVSAYAILLVCLPMDWGYAVHSMSGRSQTFLRMKSAGLEEFKHVTILAGDVGFIGYFTGGSICDIAGLVNGRAAAREPPTERISICARQNPKVLFVTPDQARGVAEAINLDDWVVCGKVDFTNVHSDDRHYLMVPAFSHQSCPLTSSMPLKLKDVFDGN